MMGQKLPLVPLEDGNFSHNGGYFWRDKYLARVGHTRIFQYSSESWVQLGMNINGENIGDDSGHLVSLSSDGTKSYWCIAMVMERIVVTSASLKQLPKLLQMRLHH